MSLGTDMAGLGQSFWTDVRPTDGRNVNLRPQNLLKIGISFKLKDGFEFARTRL